MSQLVTPPVRQQRASDSHPARGDIRLGSHMQLLQLLPLQQSTHNVNHHDNDQPILLVALECFVLLVPMRKPWYEEDTDETLLDGRVGWVPGRWIDKSDPFQDGLLVGEALPM